MYLVTIYPYMIIKTLVFLGWLSSAIPATALQSRQLAEHALLVPQADQIHQRGRVVHVGMVHIRPQLQHPARQ